MSSTTVSDRTATRAEVLALRRQLRDLATAQHLTAARVDAAGTIIVHPADAGYGSLRRFAVAASKRVGVWVNVITDDVPAAEVHAEPL
ncbi:MAG: hypothetical protein ACYCSI_04555 [Solirubrobacteraceae bacterium]